MFNGYVHPKNNRLAARKRGLSGLLHYKTTLLPTHIPMLKITLRKHIYNNHYLILCFTNYDPKKYNSAEKAI
ncbi:Uncharacterised protein [Legionella quateirensis]|uniref:Uncharacterized protein n=1 Tax=Legionella quateirensis TaxID=45072 RepID=A0A378KWW4_9GAMM|nr:hypothetical protein Lqua_1133 [Legionella quateirensis]STY17848.1 Uncharacterised protein [Legionella quateirensis]